MPQPDGTWIDIDYRTGCSVGRADWPAVVHLDRVFAMAQNWSAQDDPTTILSALDWWIERDYADESCTDTGNGSPPSRCCSMDGMWNPNWWWNRIGVQLRIGPTCLMMRPVLGATRVSRCTKILNRSYWSGATGANALWLAQGSVWGGLLSEDATKVASAYSIASREMLYTPGSKDGVKSDGGFLQHNGVFYVGGYGTTFLHVFIALFSATTGTAYEPTIKQQEVFTRALLDGVRWVLSSNLRFDPSVVGRGIARPTGLHLGDFDTDAMLEMTSAWERSTEFSEFASELRSGSMPALTGNRIFPSSDYVSHRRKDYFVSVKAHSERVARSECINGENTRGNHLGDGAMFVHRADGNGSEYEGVFPLWNWKRVPGTTIPRALEDAWSCSGVFQKSDESFVGGASDGTYGVFAMRSRGINKAWFMFDKEIVVAVNVGSPSESILDSKVLRGDVLSSSYGKGAPMGFGRTSSSAWWIHHDSVGYVFPENARAGDLVVHASTTIPRTESWSKISERDRTTTTLPTFEAWLEHDHPIAYIVAPATTIEDFDPITSLNDNTVHSNSDAIQCVTNVRTGVTGIVFWEPWQTVTLSNWTINTDRPCVVLISQIQNGEELQLTVSDPTHKLDSLSIRVASRSGGGSGILSFDTSARNGASHTVIWSTDTPDTEMSGSASLNPFGSLRLVIQR